MQSQANGAGGTGPLILNHLVLPADLGVIDWEPFRDGIDIHRLYTVPGGSSAALLRYAPGARLDRHVHVGYEHILILNGAQTDDAGEHRAGTLLIHGPGTSHAISSAGGCIVLAVWERAVSFPLASTPVRQGNT